MSGILKDRAIVLKTYDYGESSLIISALTRLGGRISFLAKGARKAGNRMQGSFRTGNIGEVVYYDKPGSGLKLIKEFSSGPPIDTTAAGLEKLCIFQAGLELAGRSSAGDELEGRIFDLVERFIKELEEGGDPWILFFALETGLLAAAGLMPAVGRCDCCKKGLAGKVFSLNPTSGEVECSDCDPHGTRLSRESCDLLARMAAEGFDGVRDISPGAEARREIGTLLHLLMKCHMDGYRLPGSLSMLKGVC